MANPNPNTEGLKKPQWQNIPTVVIRIPETFRSELMAIAKQLDSGDHVVYPSDCKALNREIQRLQFELEAAKLENEKLQAQIKQFNPQVINVQTNKLQDWYDKTLPKLKTESGYKVNSASQLIKELISLKPEISSCSKPKQNIDNP
jgi:predicted RNase H-like nuclease (RuvC/YqgF family)